jgi:hypothetical protein
MTLVGGLAGAALMGLLSFIIIGPATANLDGPAHLGTLALSTAAALIVGFLTASAVFRRATSRRASLGLFSGLAAGFGCGLLGAVWAVALLTAYMLSYGTWPQGLLYQILTVIAFPAFAAVGFSIGAVAGGLFGMIAGGVLGVFLPARR